MKRALYLLVVLFGLVVAYAGYLLVSFTPDEPYEFTFKEPTLPPELLAEQQEMAKNALSPDEQRQRDHAMEVIQAALDSYQKAEETMPQQATPTLSILNGYFVSGDLPPYFLGPWDNASGRRSYAPLSFSSASVTSAEKTGKNLKCQVDPTGTETLIGNEDDNIIECDAISSGVMNGNRLILGGPGDDKITDTFGNRIVNGGTGDDTIALGQGRSIIVLEDGWGNDKVTADCSNASVSQIQVPSDVLMPWTYKSMNFIVLSPRIDPVDVMWDGLTLKSKSGQDTLTVNENCFVLVPAQPSETAPVTGAPSGTVTPSDGAAPAASPTAAPAPTEPAPAPAQ